MQDLIGLALLHHLAVAQHHDPIGDLGHHGEVVADIEPRRVMHADELADRGQHLDLGRHIQRRGRLVEHQYVGMAGHGHGGHGALELAAGDLMGIALPEGLGRGQVELAEELDGLGLGLLIAHQPVADRAFADLVVDALGGIEGGRRALGDIGDPAAAALAALLGGQTAQIDSVEQDLAAGDGAARPRIAQGRQADGGFAGAGFPDQPQHLAAMEDQVDIVDDQLRRRILVGPRLDAQALDAQDLRASRAGRACRRVSVLMRPLHGPGYGSRGTSRPAD